MHWNPKRRPNGAPVTRTPVGYQITWPGTSGGGTSYVHQRCLPEFLKAFDTWRTDPPACSPIYEWTYDHYCVQCDL
jgi:hypothetical protein